MRTRRLALVLFAAASLGAARIDFWRDPGDVRALDFGGTLGLAAPFPKPPFRFVKEDDSGTQLKVFVRDAAGVGWNVKFGYEVKPESFGWRLARACGYFAEPNFYVASGRIEGVGPLKRHDPTLRPNGEFTSGRFQYRDPRFRFLHRRNWRWDRPPLAGSRELSGLKILIMLVSNWDNKDARVGKGGSGPNTALFQTRHGSLIYAFTDWGSGMGHWGDTTGQTNWRCEDFTADSRRFVEGVRNGLVIFGYRGDIDEGFGTGIPVSHVAWLLRYLGRITEEQFRAGLRAGGATPAEAECFTKALRLRIEEMRAAVTSARPGVSRRERQPYPVEASGRAARRAAP